MRDSGIEHLHSTYCELTGLDISCTLQRHYQWEAFLARGFTLDDLTLVCRNLRRQVKDGRRKISCMSFHWLIGDLDSFEETLAEFKALQRRVSLPPGKAAVLRDTHRPDQPAQPEAQSAAVTLERAQLAERLREWKKHNSW